MKNRPYFLPAFWIVFLGACALACVDNDLTILSYNVDNLFDAVRDGTEYPEFDPEQGGWNEALFRKKLLQTARAIGISVDGGPDIVLLQEIENLSVLEALADDGLGEAGYVYRVAPAKTASSTTVGILSRFPITHTGTFMVAPWKGAAQREILEVTVAAGNEEIVIFNNHWKSKTEGAQATEEARLEAARIVAGRVRSIRAENPEASILVVGDLNECHDEYLRCEKQYQTALIPNGEETDSVDARGSLFLTGVIAATGIRGTETVFFEPWLGLETNPAGSYFYRGGWETIDHILYLPGNTEFCYREFRVLADSRLIDPRTGGPLVWEPKHPDRGYSDHLPVLFRLVRE